MNPKVLTERRDRTFVVSINRPEVRNCVDGETAGLLFEAVEAFKADDALDVLILTGAGEMAFCAGADLKNIGTLGARAGARDSGPMGISRITDVGKPTIAPVEGYCTAGGLELACWCDFRIASETAQFGVLNRRWGVPLVDGGTQRLPRIVGLGNALYLIETGALVNAGQAQRMGLVQEVVATGQALERAVEVARVLSTYPQGAIRNDRRATLEGLTLPLDEGLAHEAAVHRDTASDPAMAEWLARFAQGERPEPIRPP
ncbi:MAG TPA: enoyl-CoA hydratase-related protein [Dehalococcoidia bacterium]|jgi:enoyl-CoA hydratase|nr:enoyl-CoA hydratase-related protein [Dehalococcoidia bacterium]